MEIAGDTRIIDLTVAQLMEIIGSSVNAETECRTEPERKKNLVYGIPGIAQAFGCSSSTASRIKRSGVIDAAVLQVGRLIITDADLAVELWKKSNQSIK